MYDPDNAPNARIPRMTGAALRERRNRVLRLWCAGQGVLDIAEVEKVAHSQISRDLASTFSQMAGRTSPKDQERDKLELLGKIAHAEAELLAAWERSKKPRERTKGKKIESDPTGRARKGSKRREAETLTEGRDGNYRFLSEWRHWLELKADILGLKAPTKLAGPDGGAIPVVMVEAVRPADAPRLNGVVS